jgi:hypothetical protein
MELGPTEIIFAGILPAVQPATRVRPDIFVLFNPILDRFEIAKVEMSALRAVIFQWSEAYPSFALVILA